MPISLKFLVLPKIGRPIGMPGVNTVFSASSRLVEDMITSTSPVDIPSLTTVFRSWLISTSS